MAVAWREGVCSTAAEACNVAGVGGAGVCTAAGVGGDTAAGVGGDAAAGLEIA